jgi:hypothetical protein
VKVKRVGIGYLELDRQYGGIGCGPTDKNIRSLFYHDWVAAKYNFINMENATDVTNHTVLFDDLAVHIRSSDDPLIYAELITNGTLNFNGFDSPGSGLYISTTRGFIGFGSLGAGLVVLCPALLLLIILCVGKRTRLHLIDSSLEERNALLKLENEKKRMNTKTVRTHWESYLFPESSFLSASSPDIDDLK